MGFKDKLAEKTKLPIAILPSSYHVLGNILLLKLPNKKAAEEKRKIGSAILKMFPYIKTVCLQKGVSGEFRQPKVEVIAGLKKTEITHHELGCKFKLDVSKIMWSKGNHAERQHMIHVAKPHEIVVDMFAGIGYWSIPIAKHTKVKEIFAIEKNPVSFRYLQENIRANYVTNIIPILGDCRNVKDLPKADRIIMGYFPNTMKFLPAALKISKKGTEIHFHDISSDTNKLKKAISKYKNLKIKEIREVKEYSPSKKHYVLDLQVLNTCK
jgi:tRNA wybutosine-synthesizing protein 2